jgi:hypothetical protein
LFTINEAITRVTVSFDKVKRQAPWREPLAILARLVTTGLQKKGKNQNKRLGFGGVLFACFLKFTLLSNYAGGAFKWPHITKYFKCKAPAVSIAYVIRYQCSFGKYNPKNKSIEK